MKDGTNEPSKEEYDKYLKRGPNKCKGCLAQRKRCLHPSHKVFSGAALITIYIRCLPASIGAERSFNLLVKELGEGVGSAVKCPLQSGVISVQKNTEVTNGKGGKKAAKMRSVLASGMQTHA